MRRLNLTARRRWMLGAAALLLAFALWLTFFAGNYALRQPVYVYVDSDDTADSVFVKINRQAHARQLVGIRALAWASGYSGRIRTGRYAIEVGESSFRTMRKLLRGEQETLLLTIPSVRTLDRLAKALSEKLETDSATWASAFRDTALCRRYGYDTLTLPCLFIPNTYQVFWNVSVTDFLARMQKENRAFWTAERREQAERAGLTPDEVVTLASIVDEETANSAEKPAVAGMYLNRLRVGMPLQADPTVKFAWRQFQLRRIYHNLLQIDSPYNTYRYTGLPPGPIRIPSVAGIEAVLHFAAHDYLYMCAKEDFSGAHNFARTYAEHLANAARYTKALNARNIR